MDTFKSRRVGNAKTTRPSAGTATNSADLVLVKEADSPIHRSNNETKLEDSLWIGPCKIGTALQRGLSVEAQMEGRKNARPSGIHENDQALSRQTT